MGKTLSLTVVAQGVETKEQAEFLRVHACDEFQGFYFNKPMSASKSPSSCGPRGRRHTDRSARRGGNAMTGRNLSLSSSASRWRR